MERHRRSAQCRNALSALGGPITRLLATANEAIAHIKSVNNPHDYDAQLGEALLCRAFAMFQLSTVFCQAYDKTTAQSNLGLPYPTEPEQVVGRLMERGTLEQLYANIEKDLLEGISFVGTKYARPKFHFTKQAAYAFATRFYLYAQQYDKAIKYADMVLATNLATSCAIGPSGTNWARAATYSPTHLFKHPTTPTSCCCPFLPSGV